MPDLTKLIRRMGDRFYQDSEGWRWTRKGWRKLKRKPRAALKARQSDAR